MDKILYMIFVASIMVGNGIYFGPCTIRQYCAIYFVIYIFYNILFCKKQNIGDYSRLIIPYIVFITLYGISSYLNGSFSIYIKQVIALYLVAITAYYTTIIIINKYHSYDLFLKSFIIVGLINATVNIMQYFGINIGFMAGEIFIDFNELTNLSHFQRLVEGDNTYTFGIMGDIVYNGYYSMILPFVLLIKYKNRNILFKYVIVIFALFSLFVVGERSSFGITLILLIYYLYKRIKKSPLFIFVIIIVSTLIIFYISDFLNSEIIQNSRWVTTEGNVREGINNAIIPFIDNFFLIGNRVEFIKLTGWPPHNVIASGFIYAGFFGGCIILYILIVQILKSIKVIKSNQHILITLAFLAYTFNGFFHNPAIVTGDVMIWILWGIVYCSYKSLNNKKNTIYVSK